MLQILVAKAFALRDEGIINNCMQMNRLLHFCLPNPDTVTGYATFAAHFAPPKISTKIVAKVSLRRTSALEQVPVTLGAMVTMVTMATWS